MRKEEVIVTGRGWLGTVHVDILPDGTLRLRSDRYDSLSGALSSYLEPSGLEVYIFNPETGELGAADGGVEQDNEDGIVPEACNSGSIDGQEQSLELLCGESGHHLLRRFRYLYLMEEVVDYVPLCLGPRPERSNRPEVTVNGVP